jgi:hypothetical protein
LTLGAAFVAPFALVDVEPVEPPLPPAAVLAELLAPLPVGPCAPDVSVPPPAAFVVALALLVVPPPPPLSPLVVVVVLPPVFVALPFALYGSALEPAFSPLRHATIINKTMTIATPATSA